MKFMLIYTEYGFCDYDLNFVSESPDRGKYNWNETEVGMLDEQECDYGTVGDSGMAIRACMAPNQWDIYDGRDCITFATLRLRMLSQVIRIMSSSYNVMVLEIKSVSYFVSFV